MTIKLRVFRTSARAQRLTKCTRK